MKKATRIPAVVQKAMTTGGDSCPQTLSNVAQMMNKRMTGPNGAHLYATSYRTLR